MTEIEDLITLLLVLPQLLINKMKYFTMLIEINHDKVKTKLKRMPFPEFKEKLLGLKTITKELERVFFGKQLKAGLFFIDVASVKVKKFIIYHLTA